MLNFTHTFHIQYFFKCGTVVILSAEGYCMAFSFSIWLHSQSFFPEKEERKKVVIAHLDHGTSLSERIKKRKRSFVNHKPDDTVDDSASCEGNGLQIYVTGHFLSPTFS